jgi:hypothetical protein
MAAMSHRLSRALAFNSFQPLDGYRFADRVVTRRPPAAHLAPPHRIDHPIAQILRTRLCHLLLASAQPAVESKSLTPADPRDLAEAIAFALRYRGEKRVHQADEYMAQIARYSRAGNEARTMCNDFGNNVSYSEYLTAFSQTRIRVKWPAAAPNLEPRDDIWPTDPAPIIRRLDDGENEFAALRWGFPPAKPKGPLVINFRSEG